MFTSSISKHLMHHFLDVSSPLAPSHLCTLCICRPFWSCLEQIYILEGNSFMTPPYLLWVSGESLQLKRDYIQSIHSSFGANIEGDEVEVHFLALPLVFASAYTFSCKINLCTIKEKNPIAPYSLILYLVWSRIYQNLYSRSFQPELK